MVFNVMLLLFVNHLKDFFVIPRCILFSAYRSVAQLTPSPPLAHFVAPLPSQWRAQQPLAA